MTRVALAMTSNPYPTSKIETARRIGSKFRQDGRCISCQTHAPETCKRIGDHVRNPGNAGDQAVPSRMTPCRESTGTGGDAPETLAPQRQGWSQPNLQRLPVDGH